MTEPIDVFVMPVATRNMAYQTLGPSMAAAFPERVVTRDVPYNFLPLLILKRPWRSKRRVLCVHWSTTLYGSRFWLKSILWLFANALALFILQRIYDFKVVWVQHNNLAHERFLRWIDRFGRAWLFRAADVLVAQQNVTQQSLAARYPKKRVVYIPHSNYVGAFGPLITDKSAMREKFGFAADDIILLSFGTVSPYKHIEGIIDAVRALDSELPPQMKLWVAGRGEREYVQSLRGRAEGSPRIRIESEYVPNVETPLYAACADWGVFYFDESELTSGSLLALLSYGCPVISRGIEGAEMVREGTNGFVFHDAHELLEILRKIPTVRPPTPVQVAATLDGSDFASVERAYAGLYESLV